MTLHKIAPATTALGAINSDAPKTPEALPDKKTTTDVQVRAQTSASGEAHMVVKGPPQKIIEIMSTGYKDVPRAALESHPLIQNARAMVADAMAKGLPRVEVPLPLAKDLVLAPEHGRDAVHKAPPAPRETERATEAMVSLRPKETPKPESNKETGKAFPSAPHISLTDNALAPQMGCYKDTREKMFDQYVTLNAAARAIEELNTLLRQVMRLDASAARYFTRPGTTQAASFQRELFLSMLLVRANPMAAIRLLGNLFGRPTEMMHLVRIAHNQGLISKESAEKLQQLFEQPEIIPMLNAELWKPEAKRKKKKDDESFEHEGGGSEQHQSQHEHDEDAFFLAEEEANEASTRDKS